MQIKIAQMTIASPEPKALKEFYARALQSSAKEEDHEFYWTFTDKNEGGCLAVVPHNGDSKWDKPWLTLATDDLAAAIEHFKSVGATDIQNSGPTNENGEPIACVTLRDPEGRLIMLAVEG